MMLRIKFAKKQFSINPGGPHFKKKRKNEVLRLTEPEFPNASQDGKQTKLNQKDRARTRRVRPWRIVREYRNRRKKLPLQTANGRRPMRYQITQRLNYGKTNACIMKNTFYTHSFRQTITGGRQLIRNYDFLNV